MIGGRPRSSPVGAIVKRRTPCAARRWRRRASAKARAAPSPPSPSRTAIRSKARASGGGGRAGQEPRARGAAAGRVVPREQDPSDMEAAAAKEALQRAGIAASEIDFVLSYSPCPDDLLVNQ